MLTALLATLFAAAGFLALGVIGDSWRHHGAAWRKLRGDLHACATHREFRFTLITTEVGLTQAGRISPAPARGLRPSAPLQVQPWPRAA